MPHERLDTESSREGQLANGSRKPGFSLIGNQTDLDYDQTHRTQADTFDKVQKSGIIHHAQVLAGWGYNTAQLPELLPRTWKTQ
jgi:hypothetical protein